jgi:hypothetical protein
MYSEARTKYAAKRILAAIFLISRGFLSSYEAHR